MAVTLDDVEAVLGRSLIDDELNRVGRLGEMAEAAIEATLPGFSFAVGDESVDIYPGDPDVLWTPRYPVTEVTSVAVAGNTLEATRYRWDEQGRIVAASPSYNRLDLDLATGFGTVTVDYAYGLDPTPADAAMVAAAMVASALARQTNVDRVQSESLGAYQVSYGDWAVREAAQGMTVPEGALRRWKRNRQVSVPLVRYR